VVYGENSVVDTIIDTPVLSYRFKEIENDVHEGSRAISSITANEFLLAQPRDLKQPDYYILHPARYLHLPNSEEGDFGIPEHFGNPKWAKLGACRTDQVIIDFGSEFSAYREFGNEAIAEIINKKHYGIYKISVSHLSKHKQKYLKKRLKYILDNNYRCYSLTRATIKIGLTLFSEFAAKHNCKGNIRNTINDILILATAVDRQKQFRTYDNVLHRFAAEYYEASTYQNEDELIIDFSEETTESRKSKESKGYINRGWSYSVRNNREVQGT
jgi:hypothetical protein